MNRQKRRTILVVICEIAVLILIAGIVFLNWDQEKKETPDQTEREIERVESVSEEKSDGEKEIENIKLSSYEMLNAYMDPDEVERIKSEIIQFISQNIEYESVNEITCTDCYETENTVEFYSIFDADDQSVLYGTYNKESGNYSQWTDSIINQSLERWEEKKERVIQTENWREEEQMPTEWNYIEEDNRDLTIENEEDLSKIIAESSIEKMKEELLSFLQSNDEFRRELIFSETSVTQKEEITEFQLDFKTQRIDKKIVRVIYDNELGQCEFSLEGGEKYE